MTDREKVIKCLELCRKLTDSCEGCPYENVPPVENCMLTMHDDALELLKEQEAVEPKTEPSAKGYWYTCGSCGWWLFQVCDTVHFDDRKRIHFCASCGKPVNWNK